MFHASCFIHYLLRSFQQKDQNNNSKKAEVKSHNNTTKKNSLLFGSSLMNDATDSKGDSQEYNSPPIIDPEKKHWTDY